MGFLEALLSAERDTTSYSGERFERSRYTLLRSDCALQVQQDRVLAYDVEHLSVSVPLEDASCEGIMLDSLHWSDELPGFVGETPIAGRQVWLPCEPTVRLYEGEHILAERSVDVESSSDGVQIPLADKDDGMIEFSIVHVPESSGLLDELREPMPIECQSVIKAFWFDYDGIETFWNYYVRGQVYDPRSKGNGRWPCQQCAHTLSLHLLRIFEETGKQLYHALSELVAYSVAVSLPDDGRWRHGVWTDRNETHARFQTDGIHLLVMYYDRTGDELFLRTASRATDYLISIADTLSDGEVWFSHDSLEQSEKLHAEHYGRKPTTTVLGKSPANTICLNTHVWTMVALRQLVEATGDDEYQKTFERSLEALHRILSLESISPIYRFANAIFDRISYDSRMPKPIQFLNKRASQASLIFLKNIFPRLVMPIGRIERDIAHTARSDYYHLQNLKDLIVLNSYLDDDIIDRVVQDGISYVERTGMIEQIIEDDRRAVTFLDALSFASIQTDKNYSALLDEYLDFFEQQGFPHSADLVSFGPVLHESVHDQYEDIQEGHVLPRFISQNEEAENTN